MGKKVLNRSNKNVKLRSILDNNLKVNLDKEKFSDDFRFSSVALSVGALGIISSCGNKEGTKEGAKEGNKESGDNSGDNLAINNQNLNNQQKNALKEVLGDSLKQDDLSKYIDTYIEKNNIDKKDVFNDIFDNDNIKEDAKNKLKEIKEAADKENSNNKDKNKTDNFAELNNNIKDALSTYGVTSQDEFDKVKEGFTGDLLDDSGNITAAFAQKLQEYKTSKTTNEMNDILKDVGIDESGVQNFLEYVTYINKNLKVTGNETTENIVKSIKDAKGDKKNIINIIKSFCEKFVKNGQVQYQKINSCLSDSGKYFDTSIRNSVLEKVNVNTKDDKWLKFSYKSSGNSIEVTVTSKVPNNSNKINFNIEFSVEELLNLKDDRNNDIQLSRITGMTDYTESINSDDLDLLFPPEEPKVFKQKIKDEVEKNIRSEFDNLLKNNNFDTFENVAKGLNDLKEITLLLNNKLKKSDSKFILEDLSKFAQAYENDKEYVAAVTKYFNETVTNINDKIEKSTLSTIEVADDQSTTSLEFNTVIETTNNKTVLDFINFYLDSKNGKPEETVIGKYWNPVHPMVCQFEDKDGYLYNDGKEIDATIEFQDTNNIQIKGFTIPTTAEPITAKGLNLFYKKSSNLDEIFRCDSLIKSLNMTLESTVNDIIKDLKFVTKKISYADKIKQYITGNVKYEDINKFVTNKSDLEKYCGVESKFVSTEEDVKIKIVQPLMERVFGKSGNVKALFNAINDLSTIKVSTNDTIYEDGIGLSKIDDATIGDNITDFKTISYAQKLKDKLLNIGSALQICQNDTSSESFKNLLKEYIGIAGTGKNSNVLCSQCFGEKEQWIKLGRLLQKWIFVTNIAKSTNGKNGWNAVVDDGAINAYVRNLLKDYNTNVVKLAKCIIGKKCTITAKTGGTDNSITTTSNTLTWWNDGTTSTSTANLGGTDNGIGGAKLDNVASYENTKTETYPSVDFDNMIWCNSLPVDGEINMVKLKLKDNFTAGDQLVKETLSDNVKDNVNFAYMLLAFGLINKNGTVNKELKITVNTSEQVITSNNLAV